MTIKKTSRESENRRTRFVSLGPKAVPSTSIGEFSKLNRPGSNQMLEDLWEIIGPSVELNLRKLPLWKVITMAYFEGSVHAIQMIEDENNGKKRE